jgi:hypothetical protein
MNIWLAQPEAFARGLSPQRDLVVRLDLEPVGDREAVRIQLKPNGQFSRTQNGMSIGRPSFVQKYKHRAQCALAACVQ